MRRLATLAGCLALVPLVACGRGEPDAHELVERSRREHGLDEASQRRYERIEKEIEELGPSHPWAGSYSWGNLHNVETVDLAPDAGFSSCCFGCTGPTRYFGSVLAEGDRVVLVPDDPDRERQTFQVITWSTERFLVAPEDDHGFLADAVQMKSSGYRGTYLHLGTGPIGGLPGMPDLDLGYELVEVDPTSPLKGRGIGAVLDELDHVYGVPPRTR